MLSLLPSFAQAAPAQEAAIHHALGGAFTHLGVHATCLATQVSAHAQVPATPSADEAREAARQELSKAAYADHPSIWSLLRSWLGQHLDPRRLAPDGPPWLSYLIVGAALLALVALLILTLRRFSRRRKATPPDELLFSDDRDAASLAKAANEAAGHGEWATAIIERFRAIIRELDEQGLLEDYPGLTAHEAGELAAGELPSLASDLRRAAGLFDSVRYGLLIASHEEDAWMRHLAVSVNDTARTRIAQMRRADHAPESEAS